MRQRRRGMPKSSSARKREGRGAKLSKHCSFRSLHCHKSGTSFRFNDLLRKHKSVRSSLRPLPRPICAHSRSPFVYDRERRVLCALVLRQEWRAGRLWRGSIKQRELILLLSMFVSCSSARSLLSARARRCKCPLSSQMRSALLSLIRFASH